MYLEILLRTLIAALFLWIIARIMGARQISQLTFYDYVMGITIGSIAGTLCIEPELPILFSLIAISVFAAFVIVVEFICLKSVWARRIFTGQSKILIENGLIIEKNLKLIRYDINDLLRELRTQGYFNIADVQHALLEANGKLSILPKMAKKPITVQDMSLNFDEQSLVANVIIDGKIMEENLKHKGKDKNWITNEITNQNAELSNVLLGTLDGDTLSLYYKNEHTQHQSIFQ